MLARIRIHDERIPQDPVTALAPSALLALQRTAGNHAIAERLQLARAPFHFPGSPDPDAPFGKPAEPAPKPAQPGRGPEPPEWFKLNSDQGTLPGEAVPGITDVARPLTESDRAMLALLLSNRTKENGVSAPLFVTTFDAAAREVWTGYVVEAMTKAFDDASWAAWKKMLSFVIRGAITTFLPWGKVALKFGEAVAVAAEKALDFGLESASEDRQHHQVEDAIKDRGKALITLGAGLTKAIGPGLTAAFTPLSQGEFYRDWLTQVPLEELHKFRLPYSIPTPDEGLMRTIMADLMGAVAAAAEPSASGENRVHVRLDLTADGQFSGHHAEFTGSPTLGKELKGHSVGSTRHVPVQIVLMKGFTPYDVAVPDMRKVETLFKAYAPMPDVMTISRADGNVIDAEPGNVGPGGGLGIHLVLASLIGIDPKAVIRRYAERMNHPTSPKYTVGHAAYDLHNELRPHVRAGIDEVMRDHVNPLPIRTSAA